MNKSWILKSNALPVRVNDIRQNVVFLDWAGLVQESSWLSCGLVQVSQLVVLGTSPGVPVDCPGVQGSQLTCLGFSPGVTVGCPRD